MCAVGELIPCQTTSCTPDSSTHVRITTMMIHNTMRKRNPVILTSWLKYYWRWSGSEILKENGSVDNCGYNVHRIRVSRSFTLSGHRRNIYVACQFDHNAQYKYLVLTTQDHVKFAQNLPQLISPFDRFWSHLTIPSHDLQIHFIISCTPNTIIRLIHRHVNIFSHNGWHFTGNILPFTKHSCHLWQTTAIFSPLPRHNVQSYVLFMIQNETHSELYTDSTA